MIRQTVKKIVQPVLRTMLPAPVRFLIITFGRTGSNMLISLLASHPGIKSSWEFIGEARLRDDSYRKHLQQLGTINVVTDQLKRRAFESATGLKVLYHHFGSEYGKQWNINDFQDLLNYFRLQKDIRIIHLKRRNRLKTVTSHRVAFTTKKYMQQDENSNNNDVSIHISREDLEREFKAIGDAENFFDELFVSHPKIDVVYETLVAENESECKRILEFLGMKNRKLITEFQKQRTRPIDEVIINYAELKDHFSGTKWESFFSD